MKKKKRNRYNNQLVTNKDIKIGLLDELKKKRYFFFLGLSFGRSFECSLLNLVLSP
jgi:hypothetical protein